MQVRVWIGFAALWLLGAAAGAHAALTHDPSLHWRTLHSAHFRVHYHDGLEARAQETAALAEDIHRRLAPYFKWTPADKTDVILSGRTDFPNGWATPVPGNRMGIYIAAPDEVDSLEDHGGWLETVLLHEYAHILHLDKAAGAPLAVREIFGRVPLFFPSTFPNAFQPNWAIEGLAAYLETDVRRGMGRGQSSFFNMLMRMEVESGVKPIRQVNQPMATWPGGYAPYLYGVEFYNFVAARRGDAKVQQLFENYSRKFLPFSINSNSKRVLGKNMNRLWDDFAQWLDEKHRPVLRQVAQAERVGERLTDDGYYGGAARALPDGRIVYIRNDGRSEPALMLRTADGEVRHLADAHSGVRLDAHAEAGVLLTQAELVRNTNVLYDLYRVSFKGAKQRLTRAGRYRYAAFSPAGDRIVAVHNGEPNALHLLNADGQLLETLAQMDRDEVIAELDWSPRGDAVVAAVWRPQQGWDLERFDLSDRRWTRLTKTPAIEMQPQFDPAGDAVLFAADYDGIYNIHRLELATGRVVRLTNVPGGAFAPTLAAGQLIYTGYGPSGFDVYRLASLDALPVEPKLLKAQAPSATVNPPPPAVETHARDYSPWRSLAPTWWFPHLVVDSDQAEVGVITAGTDVLNRHIYLVDAAYDFANETPVGALEYIYDRWYPILKTHASRTQNVERNTEGDLQRLRREDALQAEIVLPFLRYRRYLSLHFTALEQRERDDYLAPGEVGEPATRDGLVGTGVLYDSARQYPLSISRSNGRQISVVAEDSDALRSDYQGEVYTVDWREFFALGREHVLALRLVEGWGTDNPRPFELGGSKPAGPGSLAAVLGSTATFLDLFNQREYGLRGYPRGLPQLRGRRMQLASLEYRFPVMRIERGAMVPFPIAVHEVFGSAFVDSGATWDSGSSPDEYFTGAGLEANANIGLFYGYPIHIRAGYGHGFDAGGHDEVYVQLGAAF